MVSEGTICVLARANMSGQTETFLLGSGDRTRGMAMANTCGRTEVRSIRGAGSRTKGLAEGYTQMIKDASMTGTD